MLETRNLRISPEGGENVGTRDGVEMNIGRWPAMRTAATFIQPSRCALQPRPEYFVWPYCSVTWLPLERGCVYSVRSKG